MPSKAADAPAIVVKKIAKTEKIISELRSVNKLTRPSLSTSGCTPNFLSTGSSVDMGSFISTLQHRVPGLNLRLNDAKRLSICIWHQAELGVALFPTRS